MIRYKILGTTNFSLNSQKETCLENTDLAHIKIGAKHDVFLDFEEVALPPQYLWRRYKIHYLPAHPITLKRVTCENVVWQGEDRCSGVELIFSQLLNSKTDSHLDAQWSFLGDVKPVQYLFAQESVILFQNSTAFHLWPCGGRVSKCGNPKEIEQLYVEPPPTFGVEDMHVTTLSSWMQQGIAPDKGGVYLNQPVHFYSAYPTTVSLAKNILEGSIHCVVKNTQGDEFIYYSCDFKNPENTTETLDIIFKRKDK